MLRRLYDWTMALAAGRHAEKALAGVSFAESSFFPIPPDLLLIPMVLAERTKALRYALVCTVASVVGGIAGYLIGAFLFEQLARPILDLYGYGEKFGTFAGWEMVAESVVWKKLETLSEGARRASRTLW